MTQNGTTPDHDGGQTAAKSGLAPSYYTLLGLNPSASIQGIRCAYREMSKRYHPDTTDLPSEIATEKFQQLNEAYATLSSPERRLVYDQKIGLSRLHVIQPFGHNGTSPVSIKSSTYFDSGDRRGAIIPGEDYRPLSAGEIFALFLLGVTFLACLILAISVGLTQGETAFRPVELSSALRHSAMIQQILPNQEALGNDFLPQEIEMGTFEVAPSQQPDDGPVTLLSAPLPNLIKLLSG